jgi:hypothetical protein
VLVVAAGLCGLLASAAAPLALDASQDLLEKRESRVASKPDPAKELAECEALWEPATHMSKSEWSRACRRVASRLRDLDSQSVFSDSAQKQTKSQTRRR